jgi:mannose-6-phosphate isomerase-like protein (cupin superfamily)
LSLLEVSVAVDIPRHPHLRADECGYVLDGTLGIEFDDQTTCTATPGMFTLLPKGVPHALRRVSTPPPPTGSNPGRSSCFQLPADVASVAA